MICPKCNRLNQDSNAFCPFCGEVLNQEEYEKLAAEQVIDLSVKTFDEVDSAPKGPKYIKTGWMIIVAVSALLIAAVVLICDAFSPTKSAVVDYAEAFYSADFQSTVEESAVNLQKCYDVSNQSSLYNFFGLFKTYESYEDMLNTYSSAFEENKNKIISSYGETFDVDVKIKNEVKLHEAVMISFLTEYSNSYGDIIRDGQIEEMRYVYADIAIKGNIAENSELMQFIVLKIDGEWYVLTDNMLNAVSNN